ncbi:MAG: hypothetical protein MUF34_30710 [Polyangiaceae bacterium]|jgi:hypothetical protein|nr:hypothetical protein [Polyangiaceae bacterium]
MSRDEQGRWREPVVVLRQPLVINHDLVRRSLAPRPPSAMWAKLEPVVPGAVMREEG